MSAPEKKLKTGLLHRFETGGEAECKLLELEICRPPFPAGGEGGEVSEKYSVCPGRLVIVTVVSLIASCVLITSSGSYGVLRGCTWRARLVCGIVTVLGGALVHMGLNSTWDGLALLIRFRGDF